MIKLKNILTEEVYNNKATVYHRTMREELLSIILNNEFKHSTGMYGEGIYTTYEPTKKTDWLPTIEDPNPEGRENYNNYGPYQVKFMVDLINFFIFDWDVYQKVKHHVAKVEQFTKKKSDQNNFINLQAEYFKMPHRLNTEYRKRYTSEIALDFGFNTQYAYSDSHLLNGIVFFGSRDGNVLVCYNKAMIVPISVTNSDTNETINLQKILDSDLTLKDQFKDYFKKFIKSKNAAMSNVSSTILDIAKKMWKYDETTGLFSFDGNVEITNEFIKDGHLLIHFDKVGGHFRVHGTSITSLIGSPNEVGGNFSCIGTKIKSLKGAPSIVVGDFYCGNTRIESLEGAPQTVGRDFRCGSCFVLKSLEGAPKEIGGDFSCSMCFKLKSLEHLSIAKRYYVPYDLEDELERIRKERGENK